MLYQSKLTCLELEKSWDVVDAGEEEDGDDESFRLDDAQLTKERPTHRDVAENGTAVNTIITHAG
jgi:hypothetical protein